MALTDDQEVAIYQILEMPMSATVNILIDGENQLVVQRTIEESTTRQAIAALTAFLADLAANHTGRETRLKTYLNRWVCLGTNTQTIDAGGTGTVRGVSINPETERMEIRRQVISIVPFYRHHAEMSRRAQASANVPFVR
jgi:hypothetical protein